MLEQWYVARGGKQGGPYTVDRLRQFVASGQMLPTDHVWREGMTVGVLAATVRGLFPTPPGSGATPDAGLPSAEPPAGADTLPDTADVALLPVGARGAEPDRRTVPAAEPPPAEQPRKRRATAEKGAILLNQDGTHVSYRKRCTQCGFEDPARSTMLIGQGVTRTHFFCRKCRKNRDVEIRGSAQ